MGRIAQTLLYFPRQRPPEHAPVDLHQIIEQTLALRLNQLTLSGIMVERDLAPDLPLITGDMHQLQQVFLNLLLNAEQAIVGASDRGGRIVFRTRVASGRGAGAAGWGVGTAGGGRAALTMGRGTRYELIVSDGRMPDGSGRQLYRGVVEHGPGLAERFVFIAGDTVNPVARDFL